MRKRRLKFDSKESECIYHCTSKSVDGSKMFADADRKLLCNLFRRAADFCGIILQTNSPMHNHFHVVIRVPLWQTPSDKEVVRRYKQLYPPSTTQRARRIEHIEEMLAVGGAEFKDWKLRQMKQMGDLSQFMKLVKQIFACLYNVRYDRIGPVFRGRFHSVIIGTGGPVLLRICAYVDSNPLRAGLVQDPKDAVYTGYSQAVAGDMEARRGLCDAFGEPDWDRVSAEYRLLLYEYGGIEREGKYTLPPEEVETVRQRLGKLSYLDEIRCRMRFFLQGQMIGDLSAVQSLHEQLKKTGHPVRSSPFKLPAMPGMSDLYSLQSTHIREVDEQE